MTQTINCIQAGCCVQVKKGGEKERKIWGQKFLGVFKSYLHEHIFHKFFLRWLFSSRAWYIFSIDGDIKVNSE